MERAEKEMREIVISGIAGRYPQSSSIDELKDNLFKKRDFGTVDDRRWPVGLAGSPHRTAKIPDAEKFDNEYFGLTKQEADYLDPQVRIGLEVCVEALLDAGIDVGSVKGTNGSIFVGYCNDEFETEAKEDLDKAVFDPQYISGRISRYLDLHGTAMGVDTACASSFTAMQCAVLHLINSECNLAIVLGTNIAFRIGTAVAFKAMKMTSMEGKCRVWDKKAQGYLRSEAVSAVVLQKRGDAKRIYAHVVKIVGNCDGFTPQGITVPSWEKQRDLMIEAYEGAKLDPLQVHFIEAHGTGTQAGDPIESRSIAEAWCKAPGRKEPLHVGAIKSCLGHSEGSAGVCGVSKAIITFETGLIPPDQNFSEVNPKCESLADGTLINVTEATPLKGEYIGLNCFGFGGANHHCILRRNPKAKESLHSENVLTSATGSHLPRIVCVSGRTPSTVKYFLDGIVEDRRRYLDPEFLSLTNDISGVSPKKGMESRGFIIYDDGQGTDNVQTKYQQINHLADWSEMELELHFSGAPRFMSFKSILSQLISIPFAKESIEASLKHVNMSMKDDEQNGVNYEEQISCEVSFILAQMAVADLLRGLGLSIKKTRGISSGTLAHHYINGNLNRAQTIRVALLLEEYRRATDWPENGLRMQLLQELEEILDHTRSSDMKKDLTPESLVDSYFSKVQPDARFEMPQDRVILDIGSQDCSDIVSNSISLQIPSSDIVTEVLVAIGKLYCLGFNPSIKLLYPRIQYPVSRGTPTISSLVRWKHEQDFLVLKYPNYMNFGRHISHLVRFNTIEQEFRFYLGHRIDGRAIVPATAYLYCIWQTMCFERGLKLSDWTILFKNVKFRRATMIPLAGEVCFRIFLGPRSFEIQDSGSLVASGEVELHQDEDSFISDQLKNAERLLEDERFEFKETDLVLDTNDVYKEYRVRGYDYGPSFQGIHRITDDGRRANVKWTGKWVSFTDCMLQTALIGYDRQGLFLPVGIDLVVCKPSTLTRFLDENDIYVPVAYDRQSNCCVAPGTVFKGMHVMMAPRKHIETATLEQFSFFPFNEEQAIEPSMRDQVCNYLTVLEMALDDPDKNKDKICHYIEENRRTSASLKILMEYVDKNLEEESESNDQGNDADVQTQADDENNNEPKHEQVKAIDILPADPMERFQHFYEIHKFHFGHDLMDMPIISERILRQMVDIVAENNLRKSLDVHEFSCSSSVTHSLIVRYLSLNYDHTFSGSSGLNYELHHPSPSQLTSREEYRDMTIKEWKNFPSVLDIEKSSDNDGKKRSDEDKMSMDLAIFRATSVEALIRMKESNWDAKEFMESLHPVVRKSGFVILILKERLHRHEIHMLERLSANKADPKGFLSLTSPDNFMSVAIQCGFTVVAQKSDALSNRAILLRKVNQTLTDMSKVDIFECEDNIDRDEGHIEADFSWIEDLKGHLSDIKDKSDNEALWLISRSHPSSGLLGLFGELRREYGNKMRCFYQHDPDLSSKDLRSQIRENPHFRKAVEMDLSSAVIGHGGKFGGYFYSKFLGPDPIKTTEAAATMTMRGDLSSFKWMELDHLKMWPISKEQDDLVLCQIHYSALNFRDCMLATGRIPPMVSSGDDLKDSVLGFEFSGIDEEGRRVMGVTKQMGLATKVCIPKKRLTEVPEGWTLEQAATVPLVYGTAYYALITRGKIRAGETILIHSGTGGVGQAAITIALSRGLTVFATVGTKEKKEFLLKTFPAIDPRNVGNSRDETFERMIKRRTKGKGVDLVLNSLAGDKLFTSLRCLGDGGRFLEIGKVDMVLNEQLDPFLVDRRSFHGIGLDVFIYMTDQESLSSDRKSEMDAAFNMVLEDAKKGIVKPLPSTVYKHDQVEEAFRFLATGKHIGKVLISMCEEKSTERDLKVKVPAVEAIPRLAFDPSKSYILIGGLGGFGLELVNWMVSRGARKLILSSRSGIRTAYQRYRLKRIIAKGAQIEINTENMTTLEGSRNVIMAAQNMGPIGGIFNVAMVLHDNVMEKQTPESFWKGYGCKGDVTRHMDKLTRDSIICPNPLDYFVCFSSVANRVGIGQPNYNFANAVMERIVEQRKNDGLHALAIQWGLFGDVGYVAERELQQGKTQFRGLVPQRIPSCLSVLEKFLLCSQSLVSSVVKVDNSYAMGDKNGAVAQICNILGIKDPEKLDPKSTLADLGIDSLMAVEVRQVLERDYDIVMTTEEVRKLTVAQCKELEKKKPTKKSKTTRKIDTLSPESAGGEVPQPTEFYADLQLAVASLHELIVPLKKEETEENFDARDLFGELGGLAGQIFIFPGNEATYELLQNLANTLKKPAYGINWTKEMESMEDWDEIGSYIVNEMLKQFPKTTRFNLIGFSYGTATAYEVARTLQKRGRNVGALIMLDCSPSLIRRVHEKAHERDITQVGREVFLLAGFVKLYSDIESAYEMKKDLFLADTLEDRIHLASESLRDKLSIQGRHVKLSEVKTLTRLYMQRAQIALKLRLHPKYEGDVLLIRASKSAQFQQNKDSDVMEEEMKVAEDYWVSEIIEGECKVETMEGTHHTFLPENLDEISKIINEEII